MAATRKNIENKDTSDAKEIKALEEKWGKQTLKVLGWTAIPNILLERQQALGIDAVKLNILLVLLKHWWNKPEMPFPGKSKIADVVGRDRSTVQKHIKQMEDNGLLQRNTRHLPAGGQTSNEYDLSGLITRLGKLAAEEMTVKKGVKRKMGENAEAASHEVAVVHTSRQ